MGDINPSDAWWDRLDEPAGQQVVVGGYLLQTGTADGVRIGRAAARPPRPQPRLTPASQLPASPSQMLDREQAIGQAVTTLQGVGPTCFEFYGPPGVGKTALLRVLAHHPLAGNCRDGVVYLQVGQWPLEDLIGALCAALFEFPAGNRPDPRQARAVLGDRQALILLDDLDLSPQAVDDLLAAAPGCDFVLASRQRHWMRPERALALAGLPAEAALGLFERGLGRSLETDELPAVRSLCAGLRDQPLSVFQAGSLARRSGIAPVELAAEIESAAGPAQALADQLLKALSANERQLVYALAALGGAAIGPGHLAALAGLSEVTPLLENLLGAGLVEVSFDRWRLAGSLDETVLNIWDLSEWKEHALHYFADWAERQSQGTPAVLAEAEVCLALLRWAAGTARWAETLRLGVAVEGALALAGRWGSWSEVLEECLLAAQALGGRASEAWALHQLGALALILGQTRTARSYLVRALRLRQSLGDQAGADLTQANLNGLLGATPRTARPAPIPPLPPAGPPVSPAAAPRRRPAWLLALVGLLLLVIALAIPAGLMVDRLLPRSSTPPSGLFPVSTLPSSRMLYLPVILKGFVPGAAALLPLTGATATRPPGLQYPPYTISPPTPGPTRTPTPHPATAAAHTASPVACQPPAGWVFYTVQRGDSLPLIAAAVGLTPQELMQANCMNGLYWLSVGDRVWVPRLPPPAAAYTQTAAVTGTRQASPGTAVTPSPAPTGQTSPSPSLAPPELVATPAPADPPAACLEFEDLALYSAYRAGEAFKTSGFPLAVNGFLDSSDRLSNGGWVEVVNGQTAGGAGQEIELDSASLSLSLNRPAAGLALLFNEYSGELNLEVNGEFRRFANFAELNGKTLGGASLSIQGGQGDGAGSLELSGLLRMFRIGGQELWLDRLCFK